MNDDLPDPLVSPDPDGYDVPALYANVQTDDTWDEKPHHQVRDRDRDAYMRGLGYSVLRFTGSEIHRSDGACIEQVELILGRGFA